MRPPTRPCAGDVVDCTSATASVGRATESEKRLGAVGAGWDGGKEGFLRGRVDGKLFVGLGLVRRSTWEILCVRIVDSSRGLYSISL